MKSSTYRSSHGTQSRRALALLPLAILLQVALPTRSWSKKVKIVVWGLPSRDASDPGSKANLAIMDAYRKAHPEIDLQAFEGLMIPGVTSMDSGPLMAMAGGTAPDVMYVNFRISDTYIQQNFLYPLDDYVEQLKKETNSDLSDIIPPQVWPVIRREGPDGKAHTWAIPYDLLVMALNYRKDLFKRAGLDPEKPPRNWDEFYDACMRITDPKRKTWGLGIVVGSNVSAWNFMNFLWSAGGDAVAQDEKGVWRAVWNTPEAITAVRYYRKLRVGPWTKCPKDNEPVPFDEDQAGARCRKCGRVFNKVDVQREKKLFKGVVSPSRELFGLEWMQGRIGFVFNYLGDQTIARGVDPNAVGIAAVPKGPTGISGSEVNCPMYGINSTIKDKARRDAVWDFIKFFCSEESRRIRTKAFVESGFAKYCNPKWLKKFGYEAYLREVPPGWFEIFEGSLKDAKPEPYGRNCQLIYNELSRPLDKCVYDDKPDIPREMKTECARTNEKLLGIIPPEVQKSRNTYTFFIVLAMLVAFLVLTRYSLQSHLAQMKPEQGETMMAARFRRKRHLVGWIIVLPALISIGLWSYFPLLRGTFMAFQDYRIVGHSTWVGLANFSNAFFNTDFWMTMKRTVIFAGLSLLMGFAAPIVLALMLHEIPRAKVLFRTLYYLPAVTTGLVIMLLWKQFYMSGDHGTLNFILLKLDSWMQVVLQPIVHWHPMHQFLLVLDHLINAIDHREWFAPDFFSNPHILREPKDWLSDFNWVMPAIILPGVWASAGPGCIIYLAALRAIPEELYEASDLDGCGFFSKFFTITIPYLKILIIINFVGAFVGAFKASEGILVMTGGGPSEASKVLGLEIFYNAYMYLKFGYAVAMAWVLGSMLIGFTVFQLRILSRIQFTTASAEE